MGEQEMHSVPTIFILDDDQSYVRALERLLHCEGFSTRAWTSARKFLEEHDPAAPGCLVADLIMPDMNGLEVQRHLAAQGCVRPMVFITARGDMHTAVEGMRAGAVSFLPKPVQRASLIETLREALSRDAAQRAARSERQRVNELLNSLTPRERQVLDFVARGFLNKQIACVLGAAEKTVKVHRGRVMQKMGVKSVAAVVRLLAHSDARPSTPPNWPNRSRHLAGSAKDEPTSAPYNPALVPD
jgi:FixJ family two-component response regulator